MTSYLNNVFVYPDNRAVIFASQSADGVVPYVRDAKGTPLQENDVWFDVDKNCIRLWQNNVWQAPGIYGNSRINPAVLNSKDTQLNICDQVPSKSTAIPGITFAYGPNRTTLYGMVAQDDNLYFTKADGSVVLTLLANGNVQIANDLTVVGDLFADDVSYDVNQCNTLKVADDIVHVGNETTKIAFTTDKINIDASGTSIVLDDAAMTDKIVVTGQTKFINNIDNVPDIYLQNHVHHSGDLNTRIGFPANDQIGLRTGGTDRILVTDTRTTIGPELAIADGVPRLLANMSGSPQSSRFAIQNSTTNGNTRFYVIPNGTGTIAAMYFNNNSNLDSATYQACDIGMIGGEFRCTAANATDPVVPYTWRSNATEIMRITPNDAANYGDCLSFGQALSGVYATGNPYKGILVNQLHNIGWADITAGFATGSYANIFRRTNTAGLTLAHGYRRDDLGGTYFESSTSNTTGRAAIELRSAACHWFMNDSSSTPIGTQILPNQVAVMTPGRFITGSYDQTLRQIRAVSGKKGSTTSGANVTIFQITKGGDTGGSSYSTFSGIINLNGYMRTNGAVCGTANYTAKIHIYVQAGDSIAINIQDASSTFGSNNSGQFIMTAVNWAGTGNTNTTYTMNFNITYTTTQTVTEAGFVVSLDGHASALTEGELFTFTNL